MRPARRRLAAALVALVALSPPASAGEIVFSRFRPETTRILVMDDDGSDQRLVARGRNVWMPSWSPNHSRIAHIRSRKAGPAAGRVSVMTRSGGNPQALSGLGWLYPAWSPNGRWIAASCMRGCEAQRGLHLVDPDGSGRRLLTETRHSLVSSWAPGSERIAFTRGRRDEEIDIYVKTIGTKGVRRLTSNGVPEGWVSWSPGGKLIAYTRPLGENDLFDVWVMRSDGSRQRRVTKTPRAFEGTVEWAPGGGRLLFNTGRGMFTIKPDGTGRKKIAGSTAGDCCASW